MQQSAIRKPIIVVLGHVDAGKTKLLDRIRGTAIAEKEAGGITQHIGATEVPTEVIRRISGKLIEKYGFKIKIEGLLFIDTPGHEAFTNLRRRGGSIADLAILVVDINKGLEPQTKEAIAIARQYKTPFIVAANKIDTIRGWQTSELPFSENIKKQTDDCQRTLDEKIYKIVGELYQEGFESERFDRCSDFTKQIVIIPCCAKSGEGLAEILMFLAGLSQKYLEQKLKINVSGPGKGTIMEVKEERGLGTTIDVILYDGMLKLSDIIILGGKKGIIKTKIRALLEPMPLDEMRMPSEKFKQVKEVYAAAGVKIAAPMLEDAIAGSPVMVFTSTGDEKLIEEELEIIRFESSSAGVIVKADTLGALEAIVKLLQEKDIKIKRAEIGDVTRRDVIDLCGLGKCDKAVIFAFNVKVDDNAMIEAEKSGIKIFNNNVIYRLIEDYERWLEELRIKEIKERTEKAIFPAKLQILRGYVFRNSKPAIVGVKILGGRLKPNSTIMKEGKIVGKIVGLQKEGKNLDIAKEGDEVAIAIDEAVIGRTLFEEDILYTYLTEKDFNNLEAIADELSDNELLILDEIKKFKFVEEV
ncbi:MAG: translation initiation factor IF-2 [Candidatus Diapherotrites archaeon]|nr:translation initiation factor IF-2 [Candidatus Diapherotrites archaeon]